ncbi:single-stranded-DNA-specific exonuclease RecJ [Geminocystis sp. NIES-3708]|uniref:DHH family phosphoesterase n=1 Tax=Geminocystis sp. NIES-3708 TaxID=1615909 RepID=UPI0005FCD189|nr:DHH family phosphoesterase [Geminocystis sp. NIES-3708]BAQ59803.1 single-stranded-DNA-specific exonuclease RecJ [Geminocystis sp. NIES-3708]
MTKIDWKIYPSDDIPEWFHKEVNHLTSRNKSNYLTKLLWGRGIRDSQKLQWFLSTNNYSSSSPFEFGREIKQALKRLENAWNRGEKVAIWGNYNIDGITATCVLWEGLKPFFPSENHLIYYIPPGFHNSQGLTYQYIDFLQKQGINLIITADMGSDNIKEIKYAQNLGIDIIVIDHHTLPNHRPEVISFLNPLNFAENHPFFALSGVGIAYKLLEALYQQFPSISSLSLTCLLDLVAIGLLADTTPLKGDCRYLAREGIKILQQTQRSGLDFLVQLCQDNGDRPMNISQGIAQRINAINYIHYDHNLAFQLLTTTDQELGRKLANLVEKAYFNVKNLQTKILFEIRKKINNLDISNGGLIILDNNQWEVNFLPLITHLISKEYNRPTILLFSDENQNIAKGYGCSINEINLVELLSNKQELFYSIIEYHDTIELSLPIENISLVRDSINQQLRSKINLDFFKPLINIDLVVTVSELGKNLRHELRLIEPCSVDNPNPKLLIQNCCFKNLTNKNQSYKNERKEGEYIQTSFTIYDQSSPDKGFNGIWLGHYSNEINPNSIYDIVVELDYNFLNKQYYIRIIDLKLSQKNINYLTTIKSAPLIIDNRQEISKLDINDNSKIILDKCPVEWQEITSHYQNAVTNQKNLVLGYHYNNQKNSQELWYIFINIIKALIKENEAKNINILLEILDISELSLKNILDSLEKIGIVYENQENKLQFQQIFTTFSSEVYQQVKQNFEDIIKQENLQKNYFYQIPISTIKDEVISNNLKHI